MDPSHWPEQWSVPDRPDLQEYRSGMLFGEEGCQRIRDLMTRGEPTCLTMLGDTELGTWSYEALASTSGVQQEWLDALVLRTGFDHEDREFFQDCFETHAKQTPALLIQNHWPIAEAIAQRCLEAQGIQWRGERFVRRQQSWTKIDVHCIYSLEEYNCLVPILQGQKLLIFSGFAKELEKALHFGPWTITEAIQVPHRRQPKRQDWPRMLDALAKDDWTMAILCCGALAFPLANEVQALGKSAIDLGALDRIILGSDHAFRKGFGEAICSLGTDGLGC